MTKENESVVEVGESQNTEEDADDLVKKNENLQVLFRKAIDSLKEKNDICLNLEKQNKALNVQVTSLKEIVAITKSLLGIRNEEVENLQKDLTDLQEKVNTEKERHNKMISSITAANKLNEDIKNEYQSQMNLFQELREKYNQKLSLLTEENQKLSSEIEEWKSRAAS